MGVELWANQNPGAIGNILRNTFRNTLGTRELFESLMGT